MKSNLFLTIPCFRLVWTGEPVEKCSCKSHFPFCVPNTDIGIIGKSKGRFDAKNILAHYLIKRQHLSCKANPVKIVGLEYTIFIYFSRLPFIVTCQEARPNCWLLCLSAGLVELRKGRQGTNPKKWKHEIRYTPLLGSTQSRLLKKWLASPSS
jgi:hypothetical protein